MDLTFLSLSLGWDEGKPRLGDINDIPDTDTLSAEELEPYKPNVPLRYELYCAIHFAIVIVIHVFMAEKCSQFSQSLVFILFAFVFLSLTSFGALMDGRPYAHVLELFRCLTFFAIDTVLVPSMGNNLLIAIVIKVTFALSLCFWSVNSLQKAGKLITVRNKLD